jgi:hypothetical protein
MVDETQEVVEESTEEQVEEATPEQEQVEEILEPTPYQNKYRRDLDDKDTDTATNNGKRGFASFQDIGRSSTINHSRCHCSWGLYTTFRR